MTCFAVWAPIRPLNSSVTSTSRSLLGFPSLTASTALRWGRATSPTPPLKHRPSRSDLVERDPTFSTFRRQDDRLVVSGRHDPRMGPGAINRLRGLDPHLRPHVPPEVTRHTQGPLDARRAHLERIR